ncbi:MAG: AraC family ligand binding domain-containing protein [Oscillospiraceae bacterium]
MRDETGISRAGYLRESYHYFHLRDTAGQELDFHFHEFDKIVLLLSGRVDYTVEGSTYALKPWSVLLVKHHTIHRALIDKSQPYERIIIYLDGKYFDRILPGVRLTDSFDQADKSGEHLLRPTAGQRQAIEGVLSAYEAAAEDQGFGAQALQESLYSSCSYT